MGASIDTIRSQMTALLPRLRRFALSLTGNAEIACISGDEAGSIDPTAMAAAPQIHKARRTFIHH